MARALRTFLRPAEVEVEQVQAMRVVTSADLPVAAALLESTFRRIGSQQELSRHRARPGAPAVAPVAAAVEVARFYSPTATGDISLVRTTTKVGLAEPPEQTVALEATAEVASFSRSITTSALQY